MQNLICAWIAVSSYLAYNSNAMTIQDVDYATTSQDSHSHKTQVTDYVLTTVLLTVSQGASATETLSSSSASETGVVINNEAVVVSADASSSSDEYTISTTYLTPTTPSNADSSSVTETSTAVATPISASAASSTETTSSSASSSDSTSTSSSTASGSFESAMLSQHNAKRALHQSTEPLSWSTDLQDVAQSYADSYDCSGTLTHSGKPYGENLALGYPLYDGTTGVIAWYNEIEDYNFSDPGFSESTGHFTQVVWKDTTQVGCGYKNCNNEWGIYLVCNYLAQGNIIGEFADNVEELKS